MESINQKGIVVNLAIVGKKGGEIFQTVYEFDNMKAIIAALSDTVNLAFSGAKCDVIGHPLCNVEIEKFQFNFSIVSALEVAPEIDTENEGEQCP